MGTTISRTLDSSILGEGKFNSYVRMPPKNHTPIYAIDLNHDESSSYNEINQFHETKTSRRDLNESESIEQWWKGEVTEINKNDGYFSAILFDLKGNTCIAEFDIKKVFDDQSDEELNLYRHSQFAFFVVTKHGKGRPTTVSGLEFSAPYIWKKNDTEVASELLSTYFPEDT